MRKLILAMAAMTLIAAPVYATPGSTSMQRLQRRRGAGRDLHLYKYCLIKRTLQNQSHFGVQSANKS
jgi:hypothetical protein